jgi:hypothetical protein
MEIPDSAAVDVAAAEAPSVDGGPAATRGPIWLFLMTPRWLAWHIFAVVAFWGMLWLGDWQFHRAIAGNGLSWAYTFEWPLFAAFGTVFWARTIRDEFRAKRGPSAAEVKAAAAVPILPEGIGTRQIERPADDADDADQASYNAYLDRLNIEVKQHKRWGGYG